MVDRGLPEDHDALMVNYGWAYLQKPFVAIKLVEMINEVLHTPNRAQPAKLIVLDLRELDFLNSSGITMLSRFVIEARDRVGINLRFLASESIHWHARSLKNLQRLMPALIIQLT